MLKEPTNEAVAFGLDSTLTMRAPTLDDAAAQLELVRQADIELHGASFVTLEEIISDWTQPGYDMANSTRAVFNEQGEIVGYVEIWDVHSVPVRPYMWAYTIPDYRGRGIGTALFRWGEQRARQAIERVPEDAQVTLITDINRKLLPARELVEANGMTTERSSWSMGITMTEAPPSPQWPEGITVTTQAELNDLKAVYQALRDSFQDHRGFVDEPLEAGFKRWSHWIETDTKVKPSNIFLAMDGEQIAGLVICRSEAYDDAESTYINILGVNRAYRQRGLGTALLHHTFEQSWRQGMRKVSLHVDASSLTGATRMYERAGMYVKSVSDAYEKVLRPGRELSRQ
ncbi:MAG: GNAT family N-acetyltransferase [Phototrophicaceae bacterium]